MDIEETTNVDLNKGGPSEYVADIGKGVLLANAKLKLLENFVGSTASDTRQSILDELRTISMTLQDLVQDQKSGTAEVLTRFANSLDAMESTIVTSLATSRKETKDSINGLGQSVTCTEKNLQEFMHDQKSGTAEIMKCLVNSLGATVSTIVASLATSRKETKDSIDRLGQSVSCTEKNLSKSVNEAESHLKNLLADHLIKLINAIKETRDLLQKMGKEHESDMRYLLDGLETRVKNVLRDAVQSINQAEQSINQLKQSINQAKESINQKCDSLATGQNVMRKWLLRLTMAVVLLSGTSIGLLIAILMKK